MIVGICMYGGCVYMFRDGMYVCIDSSIYFYMWSCDASICLQTYMYGYMSVSICL